MSLFNPDPSLPHWLSSIPTDDDLAAATSEQRQTWIELNAAVSAIHTAWGNLEQCLSLLFSSILQIPPAMSDVVLSTITSNKIKRDLILNCASLSLASKQHQRDINGLMRRAAKIASKRNFLAHGKGAYHQRYPNQITFFGLSADLKPALHHYLSYSLFDLIALRDDINVLVSDVFNLAPIIWKARRRPSLEIRPQELGDGLLMTRNHRPLPPEAPHTPPPASPPKARVRKLSSAQKRALRQQEHPE